MYLVSMVNFPVGFLSAMVIQDARVPGSFCEVSVPTIIYSTRPPYFHKAPKVPCPFIVWNKKNYPPQGLHFLVSMVNFAVGFLSARAIQDARAHGFRVFL